MSREKFHLAVALSELFEESTNVMSVAGGSRGRMLYFLRTLHRRMYFMRIIQHIHMSIDYDRRR